MKKNTLMIVLITLCSVNTAHALPDLQKEIDGKISSDDLFLFSPVKLSIQDRNQWELHNTYSYTSQSSINYSIEELSAEAIVLLSNILFEKFLPKEWSINFQYSAEDTQKIIEEETFLIQFERKLNL